MAQSNEGQGNDRAATPPKNRFLYIFSVFVLVLVVVAFVGGPALGSIGGGERLVFGAYNGEDIVYRPGNYFARERETIGQQQAAMDSGDLPLETQLYQVWRYAYDRAVFHEAVMQKAAAAGVQVSETEVTERLTQMPRFQEGGRFSPDRYEAVSGGELFTLRANIREDLVHETVVDDYLGFDVDWAAEEEFVVSLATPERRFKMVRFLFEDFPDENVVAYANENADLFRRVRVSTISLSGSREDAEEIRRQAIERTATFEDLARSHSTDGFAESGGDAGYQYYYELERDVTDPASLDAVLDLAPGEVSDVLETPFGWIIYRVDEAPLPIDTTDEEQLATVRSYLNTFQRGRIEDYAYEVAEGFAESARADGFDQATQQIGKTVDTTSYFPINYGSLPFYGRPQVDDAAISDAATREDFYRTLFALELGQISTPVVLRNFVAVFMLDDERSLSEEQLAEVRDEYTAVARQLVVSEIEVAVRNPDLHEDGFNRAFSRYVLGEE